MPNHITNTMVIKGNIEKVKEFIGDYFDFSKIIPEPKNMFHGGLWDNNLKGVSNYIGANNFSEEEIQKILNTDDGGLDRNEVDMWSKKYVANPYPIVSWYDWNREYWGTKWNSYENEITLVDNNTLKVVFRTAWCPPKPILKKFSKMFSDISFNVESLDECENFYYVAKYTPEEGFWEHEYKQDTEEYAIAYHLIKPTDFSVRSDFREDINLVTIKIFLGEVQPYFNYERDKEANDSLKTYLRFLTRLKKDKILIGQTRNHLIVTIFQKYKIDCYSLQRLFFDNREKICELLSCEYPVDWVSDEALDIDED